MQGAIFLLREQEDKDRLVKLCEGDYDSEDLLQGLLADYPELLAGEQIDPLTPRRWLLIAREVPLPSEEEGSGRWSVDHVFVDQDGVPTLVEVKRSNNTEIRRQIVGQLLEYAANAVLYWSAKDLQELFADTCKEGQTEPEVTLQEFLGDDGSDQLGLFWERVETNLRAGRIRLIFVSDQIPPELRRIVEFLNEQFASAEVLAVEIKRYEGEGLVTLVPRVIGHKTKPLLTTSRRWDEQAFLQDLENRLKDKAIVQAVQEILKWSRSKRLEVEWGRGRVYGTFKPKMSIGNSSFTPIVVGDGGKNINIRFGYLREYGPPFSDVHKRLELLRRLNAIPGVHLAEDQIDRFPNIPLSVLRDPSALQQFLKTMEWAFEEFKKAHLSTST